MPQTGRNVKLQPLFGLEFSTGFSTVEQKENKIVQPENKKTGEPVVSTEETVITPKATETHEQKAPAKRVQVQREKDP